jgi:hypothetical protein
MSRPKAERPALKVGQVAARWGIGVDRVRELVETGQLPGAFRVPASGKYGSAIRIPLAAVEQAEGMWALRPDLRPRPERRRPSGGQVPALRHFPELSQDHLQCDVECREDERR